MKMFLAILAMLSISISAIRADDLDDYVPTARDEAVGILSAKRAEAKLLKEELAKRQAEIKAARDKMESFSKWLRDTQNPAKPYTDEEIQQMDAHERRMKGQWQEVSNQHTAAQDRAKEIEGRLETLDGEIKQAKADLQKILDPDAKDRANLRPANNRVRPPTPRGGDKCGMHP